MFVNRDASGSSVGLPASWKLESSATITSARHLPDADSGGPKWVFPASRGSRPASRSAAPMAAAEVPFPCLPVHAVSERCRVERAVGPAATQSGRRGDIGGYREGLPVARSPLARPLALLRRARWPRGRRFAPPLAARWQLARRSVPERGRRGLGSVASSTCPLRRDSRSP